MEEKIVNIPVEAVQLLINALVKYPYQEIAPVINQYQQLVSEANK